MLFNLSFIFHSRLCVCCLFHGLLGSVLFDTRFNARLISFSPSAHLFVLPLFFSLLWDYFLSLSLLLPLFPPPTVVFDLFLLSSRPRDSEVSSLDVRTERLCDAVSEPLSCYPT